MSDANRHHGHGEAAAARDRLHDHFSYDQTGPTEDIDLMWAYITRLERELDEKAVMSADYATEQRDSATPEGHKAQTLRRMAAKEAIQRHLENYASFSPVDGVTLAGLIDDREAVIKRLAKMLYACWCDLEWRSPDDVIAWASSHERREATGERIRTRRGQG